MGQNEKREAAKNMVREASREAGVEHYIIGGEIGDGYAFSMSCGDGDNLKGLFFGIVRQLLNTGLITTDELLNMAYNIKALGEDETLQ